MVLLAGWVACRSDGPPVVAPPPSPEPAAPVVVVAAEPPRLAAIAVGESTTCARDTDRRVRCVGKLVVGPVRVDGDLEVTDLELCARTPGSVRCLRDGLDRDEPTAFVEVARGAGTPIGRDANGLVWSFVGADEDGAAVREVALPAPARRVVADGWRACALLTDDRLLCWDPVAAVAGPSTATVEAEGVLRVDATYLRTCWATADAVWCRSDGRPARIAGITRPAALAVGRLHACAVEADGGVACWGDGALGQLGPLGTGARVPRSARAVRVPGLTDVIAIDAGDDHTCAVRASAPPVCWGRGDHGQLTVPH